MLRITLDYTRRSGVGTVLFIILLVEIEICVDMSNACVTGMTRVSVHLSR